MEKIFKKNSKTFSFASIFFPKEIHQEITNIYAFFRFSDDFSDNPINNPDFDATIQFGKKIKNFENNKKCKIWLQKNLSGKIVQEAYFNYFKYGNKFKVPKKYMEYIFKGYMMDKKMDLSESHQIETMEQLIRYSFCVAGSVAILLAYTIKDKHNLDEKTLSQFSAIAIGYQLTNISRDIITDAKMKRCYVPWMTSEHKNKLFSGYLDNSIILKYSKELVELADAYYEYGIPVLDKIPQEVANGLKISTRIYREIGLKIYKRDIYPDRMYTTEWEKIKLLINNENKPFVCKKKIPFNPIKYLIEKEKEYHWNGYYDYTDSDINDRKQQEEEDEEEKEEEDENNINNIVEYKESENIQKILKKKSIIIFLIIILPIIIKYFYTSKNIKNAKHIILNLIHEEGETKMNIEG